MCYRLSNVVSRSLFIEFRLEYFLLLQNVNKTLAYSSFTGTKMHGYCVYITYLSKKLHHFDAIVNQSFGIHVICFTDCTLIALFKRSYTTLKFVLDIYQLLSRPYQEIE